jgi:hypothetical protein
MKLRKNLDPGKCCATRCTQSPTSLHTQPDGNVLWWCAKHSAEVTRGAEACGVVLETSSYDSPAKTPPAVTLGAGEMISAAQMAELEIVRERTVSELAEVKTLELTTPEEARFAEDERRRAREAAKAWDAKRKEATGPLNQALKAVNGWFRSTITPLKELDAEWSAALNIYRQRVAEEQQRLLQEAQLAAEGQQRLVQEAAHAEQAGDVHAAEQALVAAEQGATAIRDTVLQAAAVDPGTQDTYIDHWVFEILDATVIPREYLSPDMTKIGKVVQTLKGLCEIPGVRVYNRPIARSRR